MPAKRQESDKLLQAALDLIDAGKVLRGRVLLQSIIDTYPETAAAAQADDMLRTTEPPQK